MGTDKLATFASSLTSAYPLLDGDVYLTCSSAVLPIGMNGCPEDKDGLCPLDTFITALRQRISQVDFAYDCNAD